MYEDGILDQEADEHEDPFDNAASLLDEIHRDKEIVDQVVARLPKEIKRQLRSKEFAEKCKAKFEHLDEDGSGVLEPEVCPRTSRLHVFFQRPRPDVHASHVTD